MQIKILMNYNKKILHNNKFKNNNNINKIQTRNKKFPTKIQFLSNFNNKFYNNNNKSK